MTHEDYMRQALALAREAIAVDAMAQRFGKKFYQNGARISGIVEIALFIWGRDFYFGAVGLLLDGILTVLLSLF